MLARRALSRCVLARCVPARRGLARCVLSRCVPVRRVLARRVPGCVRLGVVLLLLCVSSATWALAGKRLVVGVEDLRYPPQYWWDPAAPEGLQYQGYGRDVLDAFARDSGYEFEYRPFPVARLYVEFLEMGSVDLKYPDNPQWRARAKEGNAVAYSDPVARYVDGVMVRPGRLGMPRGHLRILGIVRGFTPLEYLEDVQQGRVALEEGAIFSAILEKCLMGRVDGVYGNVAVAAHLLRDSMGKPGALVFDPDLPHTEGSYRLSSVAHPEIIREFNAWLKANKALVDSLKARHRVEEGLR